jgi:hypothetical protein
MAALNFVSVCLFFIVLPLFHRCTAGKPTKSYAESWLARVKSLIDPPSRSSCGARQRCYELESQAIDWINVIQKNLLDPPGCLFTAGPICLLRRPAVTRKMRTTADYADVTVGFWPASNAWAATTARQPGYFIFARREAEQPLRRERVGVCAESHPRSTIWIDA